MKKFYLLSLLVIFSLNLFCQTNWKKYADNPVMGPGSPGQWDENLDYIGSVIFSDDTYMMWYSGWSDSHIWAVGLATSEDGIKWMRDTNNPVFEVGPSESWEQDYVSCGDVTLVNDTFHMWYNGRRGPYENLAIGHATSIDGINWERDPNNPVLINEPEGSWDYQWIWIEEVVFDGNEFHMWYVGGGYSFEDGGIGHAISPDGVEWTRDPNNPVLVAGDSTDWDYPGGGFPSVVFDGIGFHMWYCGGGTSEGHGHIYDIGYATSTDGSHWNKDTLNNPVLEKGPNGTWDAGTVFVPNVIDSAGSKYKMWYNGMPPGNEYDTKFGYAESSPFVYIPDPAFLKALIEEGVDTNGDGLISYREAEAITTLNIGSYPWPPGNGHGISSLEGIHAFINLDTLSCANNKLTSLDVSNNPALSNLYCRWNQLTSLDVSNNKALAWLGCPNNKLTSLIISNNNALTTLWCEHNQLTSLDVSNITSLEDLDCANNQLTNLDVSNNTSLLVLSCGYNQIASLDISSCNLLDLLSIEIMPSIYEVCVWEGFSESIVYSDGSPNVCFQTDCNGDCSKVGIDDIHHTGIFTYPNPTNAILNIETLTSCPIHYELTSLNGRLILKGEIEGPSHQLDLSSIQNGVYFITVRSRDYVRTEKIIKL